MHDPLVCMLPHVQPINAWLRATFPRQSHADEKLNRELENCLINQKNRLVFYKTFQFFVPPTLFKKSNFAPVFKWFWRYSWFSLNGSGPIFCVSSFFQSLMCDYSSVVKALICFFELRQLSICRWIGQEPEAPARNRKNQTLRFGKLDYPILSIPIAVRGVASSRRGSFSSSQATSGWKIGVTPHVSDSQGYGTHMFKRP
jgi:hypothetical protein